MRYHLTPGKMTIMKKTQEMTGTCERVTGRKARGLQMEEIGFKCQTFLSLKRQEETS